MHSLRNRIYHLLRRSESVVKLDMIYLTKGSFWTSISFLSATLTSFITLVAFGNLLPKETYGTYSYLVSLAASLSFFTLSGTGYAVVRAIARGKENILPSALKLQLKYNLLAVATIFVAAIYYAYKSNFVFAIALAILAAANPISEAFHIYGQVLTGRSRFDLLAKVTIINGFLSAGVMVTALLLTKDILIIISLYALLSLVPNIIAYYFSARGLDTSRPDPQEVMEMRRTSFHITAAGILGTVVQYLDKIILFHIAGAASLAIYGFSMAGPERLKGLIKNWISISLPRSATRSLEEIDKVFSVRLFFSILIGVAIAALYIIFSPLLFKVFLPRYLAAIKYSQVYALSLVAIPISTYVGNVFGSQNMLRAIYTHTLTGYIIRIALYIVLGWKWQIWGLVIASAISYVLIALSGIIILKLETKRLAKYAVR